MYDKKIILNDFMASRNFKDFIHLLSHLHDEIHLSLFLFVYILSSAHMYEIWR